jgi:tetratricopeptide (TPR) repeat protein
LRPSAASRGEAEKAFGTALDLQTTLAQEVPDNDLYKKDLARTHYNRGILYASVAAPNDPAFRKADADFREAIRVLEPIARKSTDIQASQELARSYNNLAALLAQGAENDQMLQGVGPLYEQAIRIHEELTASSPANREVKFELAKFSDNYAEVLRELKSFDAARRNSGRALALLGELVRPSPSLGIEQADAHNLRGRILQSEGSRGEAAGAYRQSLTTFVDVAKANDADRLSDFHLRFGDLLLNLASLRGEREGAEEAGRLLADSVRDYVAIGRRAIASGAMGAARDILDNLSRLMAALAERDRSMVAAPLRDLQNEFERRGATP